MNDQIETAVEAASDLHVYTVTRSTAVVIGAFTIYGGYASIRDSSAKVRQFVQNRKAKKATEKAVDSPQQ
jgi:hypothetical protein